LIPRPKVPNSTSETRNPQQVDYEPFKKVFLRLVPEIANMSADEVAAYRSSLDGIKVRGKNVPPPIKNWFQCGLNDRTLAVIKRNNWKTPTPIQCQAIPVIMSGRDCIGVAKTGSGKTGSYLLPCFRHVLDQRPPEDLEGPSALIFTPARELCIQVFLQAKKFFKHIGVRGAAVYGGAPVADQIAELNKRPQVVVCTPGRMIDMLCANAGKVTNLRRVTYIVVDEADRMFDLGFEPQIVKIMENTRPDAQRVLFSATFPKQMESLAKKHLKKPVEMVVGGRSVVSSTIDHYVELREDETKFLRTLELLGEWFEKGQVLIFVEQQVTQCSPPP
jgi:ATP-dependent RNA helicase DDX46/PRP5